MSFVVGRRVLGYLWGRRWIALEMPIINQKERQTYYGAANLLTGEFHLKEAATGDGENTVGFVKWLQLKHPGEADLDNLGWSETSPLRQDERISS